MQMNTLGNSGLQVSVMGIGCWPFGGGYWGDQPQKEVDLVVSSAIDKGINFFDNAQGYTGSEESLGRALKNKRNDIIICDKVGIKKNEKQRINSLDESLKKLNTDFIDIYMIHWPSKNKNEVIETLQSFERYKQDGKIRHIGVSNFGIMQMKWIEESGIEVTANQLCYNIACRAIETEIWPVCKAKGYGTVGYMPILQGILSGKYKNVSEIPHIRTNSRLFADNGKNEARHQEEGAQAELFKLIDEMVEISADLGISASQLAVSYCVCKGITTTIIGCRNLDQLDSNIKGAVYSLPEEIIELLDEISLPILNKLGSSADYYQSKSESRIF